MAQKKHNNETWFSKNIRPLCLLILSLTISVTAFVNISPQKFKTLCDLAVYVFGYYFIRRSVFDKQAIKIHYKRGRKNEQMSSS